MKGELVGGGLLAKSFKNSPLEDDVIYICAGVSDSQETRHGEFERERLMIEQLQKHHANFKAVYFSSILAGQHDTPYYRHKLEMESLIKKSFREYLILRLPQIVGLVNNGTLFCTFVRNIYYGETINIQRDATRALIDINDLTRITSILLKDKLSSRVLCVCPRQDIAITDLISEISDALKITAEIYLVDGGVKQFCCPRELMDVLGKDRIFDDEYIRTVIRKNAIPVLELIKKQKPTK